MNEGPRVVRGQRRPGAVAHGRHGHAADPHPPRRSSSTSSAQGTYSAAAGVFDQSWATLYAWKTNGQAFTVGTAAQPTFEVGATTTSPGAVARGESLSVTTDVSNTSANPAANIVVDVEIRDPAGTKMLQQYAQGHVFSASQTRQFVFIFQVPASLPPATYYVDVAVFNGSWSTLYVYGWHEASFTVN